MTLRVGGYAIVTVVLDAVPGELDRLAGEDALLQASGLGGGFEPQVLDERPSAYEKLPERVAPATGAGVGDHQPAMGAFVEWVKLDELPGPQRGGDQMTAFQVSVSESGEDRDVEIAETLAPPERPVGIALLGQRLTGPRRRSPLEQPHSRGSWLGQCRERHHLEAIGIDRISRAQA